MIRIENSQQSKNNSKLPSFNKDFQKLLELLKDPKTSEKVSDLIYPILENYLRDKKDFFSVVYWNRFENEFILLSDNSGPFLCPFGSDFLSYFGIYRTTSGDQDYNSFVEWLKSKKVVKKNFFITRIDKEELTLLIKEELINQIGDFTNLVFEAKEKDSFVPIRDLIFKGLIVPFDFLSQDAQFEYYWKNLDLFIDLRFEKKQLAKYYARNETILKLSTPLGFVECIQPKIFIFQEEQNKLISDFPFCLYEEQIIDYIINYFLNNTKQSLKEKLKVVDFLDRIIYYDNSDKKLIYTLKEFKEKQFLQLYFFDKLDEIKKLYRENNPVDVSMIRYSAEDYTIKNLLNPSMMASIMGIDRFDFDLHVRPKIENGLIELFDYLNNLIPEYEGQIKNSILEYYFRIGLEYQIHPELLSILRVNYKGQHQLL